ncbi:MAG TPA: hypothetical protein VN455_10230 [Methanotrichaceae archaeon]|nr:hypothetical protein [Methanotrichaceae archaeon]
MAEKFDSERFNSLPFEDKVDYLVSNLKIIPKDQIDRAITTLIQAGEIEYAAILARDNGMINRALEILVQAGDYLWAALMAKNAGLIEEAHRLYSQGLGFYVDRGMWGHAVAVATALQLPSDEIEALYMKGVNEGSQSVDVEMARAMIDAAATNLEITMASLPKGTDEDAIRALREYRARQMEGETIKWPAQAATQTTGKGSIFEDRGTGSAAGSGGTAEASGSQSTAQGSQAGSSPTMSPSDMSQLAAESSGERDTSKGEDYEVYARWRGGSDRGMRSVEGTGRLDRKPDQSEQQ